MPCIYSGIISGDVLGAPTSQSGLAHPYPLVSSQSAAADPTIRESKKKFGRGTGVVGRCEPRFLSLKARRQASERLCRAFRLPALCTTSPHCTVTAPAPAWQLFPTSPDFDFFSSPSLLLLLLVQHIKPPPQTTKSTYFSSFLSAASYHTRKFYCIHLLSPKCASLSCKLPLRAMASVVARSPAASPSVSIQTILNN